MNLADEAVAEQASPVLGVDLIRVIALPSDQVRVEIVGTDVLPIADIQREGQTLVINANPGTEIANDSEEELEITVTATRTETTSQDVPQSIQVISNEVIEDRETNNITEALRTVPGIIPSNASRSLFNNVTIRGFNADYRLNGLRGGLSRVNGGQTANIERIEILKGPASVLYGQGSFGGTVNLITKQPTDEPLYKIDAAIGSFDLFRGEVDLSGSLNESETLKYRLNIAGESENSFIDFFERDRLQIAPVLSWQISEDTKLTLEGEYSKVNSSPDLGLPARGTILSNLNGEIPRNRFLSDPNRAKTDVDVVRVGYNLEHDFSDNWKVRNSFQFTDRFNDNFIIFPADLQADDRTLDLTYSATDDFVIQEYLFDTYIVGSFKTGSIEHELLTGIELFRTTFSRTPRQGDVSSLDVFNPDYDSFVYQPPNRITDVETVSRTLGIYIQDKISFTDNLIMLIGGRFDTFDSRSEVFTSNTVESQRGSEFSPRIGVVYKPIPELSLYSSYSRSFVPTFFALSSNGESFDPQRGTQFEVGAKANFSDNLSLTLAYFDLSITNVLTQDQANPTFSIQTGKQSSKGMEFFLSGEVMPGWNVIGGYTYNDVKVTADNTIPVGNRLNNAPQHSASLWTSYEIQKGNLQGLGFGLGLYFVGDRQGDLENTFEVPSYFRTDASISYKRNKFKAAINFRNLFDINYVESAQNDSRIRPGAPFTVIGSVSWEL